MFFPGFPAPRLPAAHLPGGDAFGLSTEMARWNTFAWQAGWVFALRSAQLWAEPTTAACTLSAMAAEKQRAFLDGWAAAGRAALGGGDARAVAAAAFNPARRRVAANLRQLHRTP